MQKQYYSASYLAQYADLASNCYLSSDKSIKCNYYTAHQRLLSIDVFPPQDYPTDVIVDVKIGVDPKYANEQDVDFFVYISDGKYANGIGVYDPSTYQSYGPCNHVEGKPGSIFRNKKTYQYGPFVNYNNPFPQAYQFLFNTKQKWATCCTSTKYEGSYTTAGHYTYQLYPQNGLKLEIYSDDDKGEVYNFRYITVDIKKDYLPY